MTGLYYSEIALPTGKALAAATDAGIARLELRPGPRDAWLKRLKAEFGQRPVKDDGKFALLMRELDAYFSGRLKRFNVKLDVTGTPFQLSVWKALGKVPYGRIVTYGMLADALGRHGAARAVGGALHANHVPIVIPCHRVVAAGGGLGGYGSGLDIKRRLLELEDALPASKGKY